MKDEVQERGEWLYAEFIKMAEELEGPIVDFFRESSEEIRSILDQRAALADLDISEEKVEKLKKLEETTLKLHAKILWVQEQLEVMDQERN
jgi:DNA helicase TIP49 (TBP-interacting protein)